MSTPVSTTVIALDVPIAPTPVSAGMKSSFAHLVDGVVQQLGFVTREVPADHQNGMYLTVTLAPAAPVDSAMRRLAAAVAEFEKQNPPLKVRAVAHYGTVFHTETGGKSSYMGSAIRAAQHALAGVAATAGLTATRDFSDYAASAKLPFRFQELKDAVDAQGPAGLLFVEQADAPGKAEGRQPGLDAELVQYLKRRLAEEVGPFAGPMVDMAMRTSPTPSLLVAKLTNEVDNPKARQRFEADALDFINAHGRK